MHRCLIFCFHFLSRCQGTSEVHVAPREALPISDSTRKSDPFFGLVSKPASPNPGRTIAYLPESGQVIRALPTWQVPKDVIPEGTGVCVCV